MGKCNDHIGQHGDNQHGNQNVVDFTGGGDFIQAHPCAEQNGNDCQRNLQAGEDLPANTQIGAHIDGGKGNRNDVGNQISPCRKEAGILADGPGGEGVNAAGLGIANRQLSCLQSVAATDRSCNNPAEDGCRACIVHSHTGKGEDGAANAAACQHGNTCDQAKFTSVGFVRHCFSSLFLMNMLCCFSQIAENPFLLPVSRRLLRMDIPGFRELLAHRHLGARISR